MPLDCRSFCYWGGVLRSESGRREVDVGRALPVNKRFLIASVAFAIVLIAGAFFVASRQRFGLYDGKVKVVASFYPYAEFAKQVGGSKVDVVNITPAGAEPHDYEPSPQDIITIRQSRVFIYSGAGFEPWVDRVLPDIKGSTVVKASDGIKLLPGYKEGDVTFASDPHIHLDPLLDKQVVATIAKKLAEVDPKNREYYSKNDEKYSATLSALDAQFRRELAKAKRKDFITSHAAFAYLAKRYGLRQVSISGLNPDAEPSPAKLAEISQFAKKQRIRYIFFEKLVSPKLAETIAREVGAKTLVLNPIEGLTPQEQKSGQDFIGIMKENLTNLKLALEVSR